MPTYRFKCTCGNVWTASQKVGEPHTSICSSCSTVCENNAFGGTGVQFAGKLFTNQLTGFPDNTRANNLAVDKLAEESEREAAAYDQTLDKETMAVAKEISAEKRSKRSGRFRADEKSS